MYAGRIVEDLPAAELLSHARHPYTRALLAAVPDMTSDRHQPLAIVPGRPADPARFPVGCAFAPRCPFADQQCLDADPDLVADADGRRVACWHADRTIPAEGTAASDGDRAGHADAVGGQPQSAARVGDAP
jgi:oligopeptide/dipeptide ABC transporter ATP-binding protein